MKGCSNCHLVGGGGGHTDYYRGLRKRNISVKRILFKILFGKGRKNPIAELATRCLQLKYISKLHSIYRLNKLDNTYQKKNHHFLISDI